MLKKKITNQLNNINTNIEDDHIRRLFFICIVIFVGMSIFVPKFLSTANLKSMAFQFPEFGLLAMGMLIAMLSGGIDLSVIAVANLSGIFAAYLLTGLVSRQTTSLEIFLGILLVIVVSLLTGLVAGFINGLLVSKVGISPILATLGTSQLFTGIALVITKGHAIYNYPESFIAIGNGSILGIPNPFLIFILLAFVFTVILNKTPLGFKLYMVGSNNIASKFSGIKNENVLIKTYMFSATLAAIAGIIIIARTNSAKAGYGSVYLLQAVLVSVMGGANPKGGVGKIIGVVLAVVTLQFISSGFNLLQISNFAKEFAWGGTLLLVMVVNYILNKRKERLSSN